MWKYVFIVLIYVITLEVWKCGNVEICLPCLHCLHLCNNSGSVEMCKCGNMSSLSFCLITLEVWKCGNMSSLSLSNNSGNVEMWKYVSRTNNYKNMRPGGELKLAMCLSCDWQQSEVTQVISPHASPIFNSKIIQDAFPDFHTFRVIRVKQTRHISRFPVFHNSRVIG